MSAPKEVLDLVERFGEHLDVYRNGTYKEAQLRQEFLDPFFRALGWDMDNTQGFAEAYKEVIHEDTVKIGDNTKAPDYSFRIGGTRKYFVEAKKPSVYIKGEPDPAFQLRRYAWSAKLPLSILTDFEEFAVYDCRIKPSKNDPAATARVQYWTFRNYADKWDEIAAIFSKDALHKGSFDKFAATTKGKRGTAEVDSAFLDEIETWRETLAKNIALRNPDLSQPALNYAVQQSIDRIIFLRICEDRGIEPYGQLQALANGTNTYKRLSELFRKADERYNSGLFHFHKEQDRAEEPDRLTLGLDIDDKPLKEIFQSFYYPDSPYEFSVIGADILGSVYERFLGKVIRLTAGHHAKIEEKPEVKKAGGVYYTPTYIVDYIVKHTVGKLLEGKTPKQVEKLRILDPACGSGSFLIGAYQYLLDWHRDWYEKDGAEKHAKGKQPKLYQGKGGMYRLTTSERKRILTNNIYGVDIDSQAVEVTKLSLLLKVLEGESDRTLQTQLFHERVLPDLGRNIKCGNSLIGPDFYEISQLDFLDDNDRARINVFDWNKEFPEIMRVGGFDAVIGNPPYGAYLYEQDKSYLNARFSCQTYQLDSYLLFLEKAVKDLIKMDGFYGMIVPNPWLTNLLQTNIRRFVVERTRVLEIVHFKFPVFPKVTVDTEIVLLQKTIPKNWEAIATIVDALGDFLAGSGSQGSKQIRHNQEKWQRLNGGVINIFTSPAEEALAKKCVSNCAQLSVLCEINVGIKPYQVGKGKPAQTKTIVESRPFDSDKAKDKSYRLYLRGSDINRYVIAPLEPRYLKYGPWLAEPRPAAKFDAPTKILMRQTGDSLIAAMDTNQHLCLNNMHVLVPNTEVPSPKFILGVINSKLLNKYYQTLNPEAGEALAEVKKTNVARLPIRTLDMANKSDYARHDRMVALVEQMLLLKKQLVAAKAPHEQENIKHQIDATDRQIDKLVYELYGLTDEEIKIVEGE